MIAYSKVTTIERGTCYPGHRGLRCGWQLLSRGYTLCTCRVCGYSYRTDYTLKLAVPSARIYNCKAGKNKVALRWYWVSNISDYQIRYSKKRSMKGARTVKVSKARTSKTMKKLSKKKCYCVQIRTYVKLGKKVAYSSWSSKWGVRSK